MNNKFNSEKKISNNRYMKYKAVEVYYNSKRPKGAWKNDPSCLVDLELYTYYQHNKLIQSNAIKSTLFPYITINKVFTISLLA